MFKVPCLAPALVSLTVLSSPPLPAAVFQRGDANADGKVDIADALTALGYLFLGSPSTLECEDAADIDDGGALDIGDPVYLLSFLFLGGPAPPAPWGKCGEDPSDDFLSCLAFPPCTAPCSQKPGDLGPPAIDPFAIDWPSYFNWEVGRAWQFQTTGSEGTYSQYLKEKATKNGQDVYVVGWSSNWSDQLDYWYFSPDGAYLMGQYDEDQGKDVFFCPPYRIPNAVELGKEYAQEVQVDGKTEVVKATFELLDRLTVPYGTFHDVIQIIFETPDELRVHHYAHDVGHIKEYKRSSDRTDELIDVTNGHTTQPPN